MAGPFLTPPPPPPAFVLGKKVFFLFEVAGRGGGGGELCENKVDNSFDRRLQLCGNYRLIIVDN